MSQITVPVQSFLTNTMSRPLLDLHYGIEQTPPVISIHAHTYYEIIIFATGSVERYVVGQKNYLLKPGDVLVIPPYIQHHPIFNNRIKTPYSRFCYWMTEEYLDTIKHIPDSTYLLQNCLEQNEYLVHLPELQRRQLLVQMEKARDEIAASKNSAYLYLHASFLDFLAVMNDYLHISNGKLQYIDTQYNDLMEELLSYIHSNYKTNLTLQSTAKVFHASCSTIETLFKKTLKMSFYQYVTEYRIATAKLLILKGTPLKEVSLLCGYSDYSNFYRVFTKRVGISPSNYLLGTNQA